MIPLGFGKVFAHILYLKLVASFLVFTMSFPSLEWFKQTVIKRGFHLQVILTSILKGDIVSYFSENG
jgi:hypothetical protein